MPGVHRDGGRLVHRRGRCGGARGADVDSWGMDPAQRPFLRSPRGADPQSPVDAATVIASGQYGIITLQQAREYGLSKNDLRRLVRRKEWLRPHLRTYAVRRLVPAAHSPERLRCLAMAAQLAVGPGSCVAGQTAARLWGIRGLERWDGRQVHIAVPAVKIPRTLTGVELHGWDVRPEEVTEIGHGVRITEPGRTLCDTLPTLDRETAVCLMDSALHQGLLREENIEAMNRAIRGRRGCLDVRRWWGLADGRSQSPLETRVRLVRVDGGLPPTNSSAASPTRPAERSRWWISGGRGPGSSGKRTGSGRTARRMRWPGTGSGRTPCSGCTRTCVSPASRGRTCTGRSTSWRWWREKNERERCPIRRRAR